LGESIFTEGDDLQDLRKKIQDAVRCHFEDNKGPKVIRLHQVHEEIIPA
jgi:hypothetical protein